eukprot:TRINITY_DN531_c0_g1_i2.p1 TRINITY_DN531_c0_g1~~TRINITY_DN531_c0_g1_i2.p1  ORF type:complete len:347 (-),score=44.36 TRINITY_DN531_c0_g1_i2:236-1276(-)
MTVTLWALTSFSCGGGFDFVHGMLLYPELMKLGKKVVYGSFSFGSPYNIQGAEIVWEEKGLRGPICAKKVYATSTGTDNYCPEVRICSFLDKKYPETSPHFVYAYYARAFSVQSLTRLYKQFIQEHDIDTIVVIDGGSDSLMKGDESGLGDPIEDCVSVTTASLLSAADGIRHKLLLSVGFGMDRFNNVSDNDSLRAVAEITALGGFLGSVSIEPSSPCFKFYKECIDHIYEGQSFRSVMASGLVAAIEGDFGYSVPDSCKERVRTNNLYLWPMMAMMWAFDPEVVAKRSLVSQWIQDCEYYEQCNTALEEKRRNLAANGKILPISNVPTQEQILEGRFGGNRIKK